MRACPPGVMRFFMSASVARSTRSEARLRTGVWLRRRGPEVAAAHEGAPHHSPRTCKEEPRGKSYVPKTTAGMASSHVSNAGICFWSFACTRQRPKG